MAGHHPGGGSQVIMACKEVCMDVFDRIKEQIENNPVLLYMKGTPEFPQCGFSRRACLALQHCGKEFSYVDILADPELRSSLPRFSNWPTFPQLFIKGKLVGGCDIVVELFESGQLKQLVDGAMPAVSE